MNFLIGEYECKLDAKGRMVVPAALKRQLTDVERDGLVVNRGLDGNLDIYTRAEWNSKMEALKKLNQYKPEVRNFVRYFVGGSAELFLDSAGRVLLPKNLLDYAGVGSELVLVCNLSKIELWSKARYEENTAAISKEDFSELAESVMGGFNLEGGFNV